MPFPSPVLRAVEAGVAEVVGALAARAFPRSMKSRRYSKCVDTPQIAVGAVVVDSGNLLMVKRGREPAKGLWSLPGGRVMKGEYLNSAVAREVMEETRLTILVDRLLGIFEVVGDPHYVILDFMASLDGNGGIEPVAGDDVAEARWVPLDDVARLGCTPRLRETLRGWGVAV